MTEPARAMLPPPEKAFESSQAAQKYLQNLARANGYAVVLERSVKQGRYLYFIGDLGGSYRNTRKIEDEDRQRKTSSRKAGCKFEASITSRNDTWIIACRNDTDCGHEASTDTLAHPTLRRFDVASRE
ncbi:hypothetical protein CF326_g7913 [Tilletia indica]|nr:hypothetical protein CF326_g7913 [Tilletia indica]